MPNVNRYCLVVALKLVGTISIFGLVLDGTRTMSTTYKSCIHYLQEFFLMKEEENIGRETERGPDHEAQLKCDHSIQLLHSHIAGADGKSLRLPLQ